MIEEAKTCADNIILYVDLRYYRAVLEYYRGNQDDNLIVLALVDTNKYRIVPHLK